MIKHYFTLFLILLNLIPKFNAQPKSLNTKTDSLLKRLSQTKVDTLKIITLNNIALEFADTDSNKTIYYSNQAKIIAEKIKWIENTIPSLVSIGKRFNDQGNPKMANVFYDKALKFSKDKIQISKIYLLKGGIELNKTKYSKALKYFFIALKIGDDLKNNELIAKSYYAISRTQNELKNNKKALQFNKKSLEINTKLRLNKEICDNYILMGEIYRDDRKNYDTALEFFLKALDLGLKIDNKYIITHAEFEIAKIYQLQDKYELALNHIYSGKRNAIKIKNHRLITGFKLDEGLIYLLQFEQSNSNPKKKHLLKKAELLIFEALKDYQKTNDKYNISVCYDTITYLYQLQNKDKEATLMALKYAAIKDSIFSDQSRETIKNLEDQRTIELKNKEIEINKIKLNNKDKQKWIYILSILFLSTIGSLFFYQSRKEKKANKKLQKLNSELDNANKSKIKFLSILNHDLRSPVYNFIHFMQLQKESPELLDEHTKKKIETKTINSAENLLHSMEDLLQWSKGQMNNFKPIIETVIVNDLFSDIETHFKSEENTSLQFDLINKITLTTDINYLKTIIRNLTTNAIKALKNSTNAKITWTAWEDHQNTYFSIIDNANGTTPENLKALYDENMVVGIKSGLGLHLIRDLAKSINCETEVVHSNEKGTKITLKIPKTKNRI